MINFKTPVSAVAVAVFLAACGGGSGGTASTGPISTVLPVSAPTPLVVTPGNLQTSVPALTYASTSAEFAFVTAFNGFRQQMGLGLVAQNPLLDKSAQNHLDYVLVNDIRKGGTVDMSSFDPTTGRPMFHIEQADKPKFTGVQEINRAKAVGYPGAYVGEEGAVGGGKGGVAAFDSLSGTIYHRMGLMLQGVRDVGIAVGTDASQTFTLEIGWQSPQSNASDFVGVYPGDGQTGLGLFTRVETPNPFPDLSTANADFPTKTGYPVSIVVKEGTPLEVSTFTITEQGATAPLEARLMTSTNDPNRYLPGTVAFLVAKGTLKPNTTYVVSFSGRTNNGALTKTWKFTTGT
jgi:uncharacterized protein YkwD